MSVRSGDEIRDASGGHDTERRLDEVEVEIGHRHGDEV